MPRRQTFVFGVRGLTEWIAVVRVGKCKIRIPFTGGSQTGFGSVPATFVTDSGSLATIIRNSRLCKEGKIFEMT